MSKNIRFFSIFTLGFLAYYYFDYFYFKDFQSFSKKLTHSKAIAHVVAYSITLIPLFITLKILFPKRNIFELFSLNKSIIKGFTIALMSTLPMLIGYCIHFSMVKIIDFQSLFINTLSSAFFEEIIFRAFLIGTLFKYTRLGFLSSVIFGSLLFAQAHLYQSQDPIELSEIFAITFLGSVFFAWVYIEQEFNLWISIFLHFFMNLYWEIFNISENVSGNIYGNLYKILSILFTIAIIIYYKRKNKAPFLITRKSLFLKTKDLQS